MSADSLNNVLRGCDFQLRYADPRCETGRVRFVGVSSNGIGKVGVAAIKRNNTPSKRAFVLAANQLRPIEPIETEPSGAALTNLQLLALVNLQQLRPDSPEPVALMRKPSFLRRSAAVLPAPVRV